MENEQPSISVAEIAGAVQLIDIVTARGALRGEELVQVGTLRQKFVDFVEYVKSQQPQPEGSGEPEVEETSE